MVGLMATSSKRMYATYCASQICCSQSPVPVAGYCWPVPPQETLKHSKAGLAQSLTEGTAPFHNGNQSWIFTGRTDAEAEAPILWPPDVKSQLTGKDPDDVKDWRQEEKGMTGRDGWMASPTQWTWVWARSRSLWRTGKPGILQSMGSQRVAHNQATEQQQTREFS